MITPRALLLASVPPESAETGPGALSLTLPGPLFNIVIMTSFNQQGADSRIVAPPGFSRLTVPSGGDLVVTFKAATLYVRVSTPGDECQVGWSSTGIDAGALNSIGGAYDPVIRIPGQLPQITLRDVADVGDIEIDVLVVHDTTPASVFPASFGIFEGAESPHASS